MKKKKLNVDKLAKLAAGGPSRWELDSFVYNDRTTNPDTLRSFLLRIQELKNNCANDNEKTELKILLELAESLDEEECIQLLSNSDDVVQTHYIEKLARLSALEVMSMGRTQLDTLSKMVKLSHSDFILVCKRTQELLDSIRDLAIQGENLVDQTNE